MKTALVRRLLSAAVLSIAAISLAACAVVTVDVDVYKGPLVNEPDIQLQQVAVMPIAAKRLIAEFRDKTEKKAIERNGGLVAAYDAIDEVQRGRALLIGYPFASLDAQRANEILSLYDNRISNPTIRLLIDRYLGAVSRYSQGWIVLRPTDRQTLKERSRLASDLGLGKDGLGFDEVASLAKQDTPLKAEDARRALRQLIVPLPDEGTQKYAYADVVLERWRQECNAKPPKAIPVEIRDYYPQFDELSEAAALIQLIVPKASERARTQAASKLVDIAQAFKVCRAAIDTILETTLQLIVAVNEESTLSEPVKHDVNERLARIAADLISNEQFDKLTVGCWWTQSGLTTRLKAIGITNGDASVRAALNSNQSKSVAAAARLLIELHQDAKSQGYKYGIAIGPMNPSNLVTPQKASAIFRQVHANLGGAFGDGRYDAGMATLIENFLESDKGRHGNGEGDCLPLPADFDLRLLMDALAQFGEKLTYLANNAVLTGGAADEGDIRLIQAVGNSILVQVNELRARQTHREGQPARAKMLADSLGSSNSADGPTTAQLSAAAHPTEVIDRVIAFYADKRIKAIAGDNSENAAKYQEAIQELERLRAAYVYIRPPSFYLKNSYPVTSYQQNPGAEWKNMLGEQALRSLPFYDGLPYASKKTAEGLRIQAEIDKQFWQNINRVRVAGGGFTNYVIAKDDVGNWYVKNYSADPTDIINAAKQAAMFAAAPAAAVPSVIPAKAAEGQAQAPVTPGRASDSVVVTSLNRYKADEAQSQQNALDGIVALFKDSKPLGQDRLNALTEGNQFDDIPDLVNRIAVINKQKKEPLSARIAAVLPGETTDILVGLDRVREALLARIASLPANKWKNSTPDEGRKQARAIVHECLTMPLTSLVRERTDALERHRDRIAVLHDVAAPK